MRKAPYVLSLVGIGCLSLANASAAGPLASGLPNGFLVTKSLVQETQAWSCREKLRDMTIEQRRICHGYGGPAYGFGYHDDGYGYGHPGYGLGVMPFFGFTFDDDDDHHRRWRRHHRRHD